MTRFYRGRVRTHERAKKGAKRMSFWMGGERFSRQKKSRNQGVRKRPASALLFSKKKKGLHKKGARVGKKKVVF